MLFRSVYIPTCDADGVVTWGAMTAVTRHDPGECLYAVTTESGREVTVAKSQSLIVWDEEKGQFLPKPSPEVKEGDLVPVTQDLCEPPVVLTHVDMSKYLPKTEYLYGTDFFKGKAAIEAAMEGRERCPAGWWEDNNGKTFTLPYDNKGRFQRVLNGRTDTSNIKEGLVYPFSHCRENPLPAQFELNERNGIFVGLYLAEGNSDIPSGYVQISNNAPEVRQFAMDWFKDMGLSYKERLRHMERTEGDKVIKLQSHDVRGFSKPLGVFLEKFLGSGSENKFVPHEAFAAPKEFVRGLLAGYFSGDGHVASAGIESCSVSRKLTQGISFLCSRMGIFCKLAGSPGQAERNALPTFRLSIRAQWAQKFASEITMIHNRNQEKLNALKAVNISQKYATKNNVVCDKISFIGPVSVVKHPKLYDVTVPSTLNFQLANGLNGRDTADTVYMQRQIRVALEDLVTQHDGSVRDLQGNLLQIRYGEDGINATKLENQMLPLATMSDDEIATEFTADGDGREAAYIESVKADRKMMVEGIYGSKIGKAVKYPVPLDRIMKTIAHQFHLGATGAVLEVPEQTTEFLGGLLGTTDATATGVVTGSEVLDAQEMILAKTHTDNQLWSALVRFHMAPKRMQAAMFTKVALDALVEQVIVRHWKSWVEPGQPVGVIAAQSIGEPATQLTLNECIVENRRTLGKV